MTPNGVEHLSQEILDSYNYPVITAMTPNGVEHQVDGEKSSCLQAVITAMTPNGVEHASSVVVMYSFLA